MTDLKTDRALTFSGERKMEVSQSVGEGGMKEGMWWFWSGLCKLMHLFVCVCDCVCYTLKERVRWETRLKEGLKVTLKYLRGEKRQTRKSRHRHDSPEVCVLIVFPCSCCILYSTEWSGCDTLEIWSLGTDIKVNGDKTSVPSTREQHNTKIYNIKTCSTHKY